MEGCESRETTMYKHNIQIHFYLFSLVLKIGETSSVGLEINKKHQLFNEFKPSSNYQNSHKCSNNEIMSWCIPDEYDKEIEPWKYRSLTNSSFPWNYHFKFHIYDIQEVDDQKQTISLNMYFRIKWMEPRLVINVEAEDWNDLESSFKNEINVAPEFLKYLWYPDLEILGVESFSTTNILKKMASLQIYKDRSIKFNARVDTRISCRMTFDRFPFDLHDCPFQISSYYGTKDTVNCTSEYEYEEQRQRSLQYLIDVNELSARHRSYSVDGRYFNTCGVNILLNRTKVQILFQVYVPATLLAIVSWVSFTIKPDVVPGRMGLLATIFLVLINIFNGAKSAAPSSTNLNALDLYLIVCIGQVFLALIEYAIILFISNTGVKSSFICNNETKKKDIIQPNHNNGIIEKQNHDDVKNKMDSVSIMIFPSFFILFNVIYWNIYVQNLYL